MLTENVWVRKWVWENRWFKQTKQTANAWAISFMQHNEEVEIDQLFSYVGCFWSIRPHSTLTEHSSTSA